jgi:hypothetical protein
MGTTITLDGAGAPVALQSDLVALAARVTKLESEVNPPPVLKPSPTNTFIQQVGQPAIVDDKLTSWTLVAAVAPATGLQIAVQPQGQAGVVDKPTQNVTQLGIQLVGGTRTIVQANTAGNYYENPTGVSGAWTQFAGPVPPGVTPPPSSGISVSGGQLIHGGAPILLKGLAVLDSTMGSTPPSGIRSLFGPALNAIMLACGADGNGYATAQPIAAIVSYVQAANAAGFWVGLSDYVPGQPQARTGTDLANSLAWYETLSKACAGLEIFWTTENEVQGNLDANLTAIYGALRSAGDQNLIMIEGGATSQLSPATVANMHGVCWNVHIYPWEFTSLPPTQAAYDAAILGVVQQWEGFGKSADGVMPVVCGETGNATSGNGGPIDDPVVGGKFVMTEATLTSIGQIPGLAGSLYWIHDWHGGGGDADTLVVNGALTQFGSQVAAGLA